MRAVLNKKGFSLVELMVVVAIIGILAAIAVPNFQRFTAKSKQSEAKTDLAAIYSAERAFSAEWQSFFADFQNIGYAPTGNLRYRHGFSGAGSVKSPAGYNGAATAGGVVAAGGSAVTFDSSIACSAKVANAQCTELTLSNGGTYAVPGAGVTTVTTFVAGADGDIDGDKTMDDWTMDEKKTLTLTSDDVNN